MVQVDRYLNHIDNGTNVLIQSVTKGCKQNLLMEQQ